MFDENLAARLARAVGDVYPGSQHARDAGLLGAADLSIWRHARDNGLAVVTKDEDFHRLSVLHGPPPKVIWLGVGNCSTDSIIGLLRKHYDEIAVFLADPIAAFLALG